MADSTQPTEHKADATAPESKLSAQTVPVAAPDDDSDPDFDDLDGMVLPLIEAHSIDEYP